MENYDKDYLKTKNNEFESVKQKWENNLLEDVSAILTLKDLGREIFYFIYNNENSIVKLELNALYNKITNFITFIKEQRKTVYVVKANKDKFITVSNESLIQKCIERFGKENVQYSKMKICETEEDLDEIFFEDKMKEDLKNPRIVHLLTDKDCPLY